MTWYAWLIIGALVVLVLILIFTRKKIVIKGFSEEEKDELLKIEKEKIQKDLDIEKDKNNKLAELAQDLKDRLKKLDVWYQEEKEKISDDRKSEFEAYIGDSDLAGSELDKLLGINRG